MAKTAKRAASRRRAPETQAARSSKPIRPEHTAVRELGAVLDDELECLHARYRDPLLLCYLQGHTRDQAARQLGLPLRTLDRRLARGRELLRARLTRRGLTLSATMLAAGLAQESVAAAAPSPLLTTTVTSAVAFAARSTPGAVPGSAASLAASLLKTMAAVKLKALATLLLALGFAGIGGALSAQRLFSVPGEQPLSIRESTSMVATKEESNPQAKDARTDGRGDPLPARAVARLGTVRLRQGGPLSAVAFTADGKRLASAGHTRHAHLWDAVTGREIRSFAIPQLDPQGPPTSASSLAISPDDRVLAVGTFAATIHLWEMATGKHLLELYARGEAVQALAFAPDGRYLASAGGEWGKSGEVQLWDVAAAKELRRLEGHTDIVNALAFAPGGKILATAGRDGDVRVWDQVDGKKVRVLRGSGGGGGLSHEIHALAFSSDASMLAAAGSDQVISLWNVREGKVTSELGGHKDEVSALAFSPTAPVLLSGGTDGTARLWEATNGKEVRVLRWYHGLLPRQGVRSVAFSPDGQTAACALQSGVIALHQVSTGKAVHDGFGHSDWIPAVAVSPDGARVATVGNENLVRVWDRASGKEVGRLDAGDNCDFCNLSWSQDGKLLAAGTSNLTLVWEVEKGRRLQQFRGRLVAFMPDGKTVAVSAKPEKSESAEVIEPREITTGRRVGEWNPQLPCLSAIAVSSDGANLAWGGRWPPGRNPTQPLQGLNLIHLWQIARARQTHLFGEPEDMIQALAFSPDGKMVASVPGPGRPWTGSPPPVRLWEVATGKERGRSAAHVGHVNAVAFSSDGRLLATASNDSSIGIWDLASGKVVGHLMGHIGRVYSVAFTPGGHGLVSGGMDTTALVWDLSGLGGHAAERVTPSQQDLDRLWTGLGSDDAAAAYRAVWTLRQKPQEAVTLLQRKLRAIEAADARRIAPLLADLDSDRFPVRERARRELQELGEGAIPGIETALAGDRSLEARQRMRQLLDRERTSPLPTAMLQTLRAVEVLEWIATPEARQVLGTLATGMPEARLTHEAKAALGRLSKGPRF
jgi:WD40 repeat protein